MPADDNIDNNNESTRGQSQRATTPTPAQHHTPGTPSNILSSLLPTSKFDSKAVDRITALPSPLIWAPISRELFYWLADINWPIWESVRDLFLLHPQNAIPPMRDMLDMSDYQLYDNCEEDWVYWVLTGLVGRMEESDKKEVKGQWIWFWKNRVNEEMEESWEFRQAMEEVFGDLNVDVDVNIGIDRGDRGRGRSEREEVGEDHIQSGNQGPASGPPSGTTATRIENAVVRSDNSQPDRGRFLAVDDNSHINSGGGSSSSSRNLSRGRTSAWNNIIEGGRRPGGGGSSSTGSRNRSRSQS